MIDLERQEIITEFENKIAFSKNGLVPVIIQSSDSKEVLMLGYMNAEAFRLSIKTKKVHFWSRKRQKLWMKGETSGNIAFVKKVSLDCDSDTLLVEVEQTGPICHLNTNSCFCESVLVESESKLKRNFEEIFQIILDRLRSSNSNSYVTKMNEKGTEEILRKVGEEAIELILVGKSENRREIIHEATDLLFHIMLFLASSDFTLEDIYSELGNRHKKKTEQQQELD